MTLKVAKLLKKINNAVDKNPHIKSCLTNTTSGVKSFQIDSKNRSAFRFFRDHVSGEWASEVNHVYGIGGRMRIDLSDTRMKIVLYTDNNKLYRTFILSTEPDEQPA